MDFDSLPDDSASAMPAPQMITPGIQSNTLSQQSMDFDSMPDDSEAYQTPSQKLKAGVEGAAQGILGPVAPFLETHAMGVKPEDIRAREEANPITHYGLEIAGFAASALTGTGLAKVASKAAELIAPVEAEGIAAKIGSAAVKGAIENMVVSGSDEASKMVLSDPKQSAASAISNVGLSGLLGGTAGGALGSISPLWSATLGKDTHGLLNAVANRAGGIEGVIPDEISNAITESGINISPEMKASFSADPEIRGIYQHLQESNTSSGLKAQNALKDFRKSAGDAVATTLGKTPSDVEELASSGISEADAGNSIKASLTKDLNDKIDPIAKKFEGIKAKYANYELGSETQNQIANDITKLASDSGYLKSPGSPQAQLIQRALKELPLQKTAEDLRLYASNIGKQAFTDPAMSQVGKQLKGIFRDAEDNLVTKAVGDKAPEALAEHLQAKQAYAEAMKTIDNLNDRLHVGSYGGPGSFIKGLKDLSPEDVLRRLSPKNDSEVVPLLAGVSEKSAGHLRDFHLSQVLKSAASKAIPGEVINPKAFSTAVDKMTPEMKNFLMSPEAQTKVKAINALIDHLPAKMNNSGTAKTLDSLWNKVPESAMAMAAMLHGHNPVLGFLLGKAAKYLATEAPDAAKLGLLKFLGSSQPVEANGFKAMVEFMNQALKGEAKISKATKAVFTGSKDVLPESAMPSENENKRLDSKVAKLQADTSPLLATGGHIKTYLPDHSAALSETTSQAVNYINSVRPKVQQNSPLDSPIPVSKAAKSDFNEVLSIANQPLIMLNKIKNGTVTPANVVAFKSMYPDLYSKMANKLTAEMTVSQSKHLPIPYKTRMGLSMFMGHPMDSTMSPMAIMAAQPRSPVAPAHNQSGGNPKGVKSAPGLQKMPAQYQTQDQARQAAHLKQ